MGIAVYLSGDEWWGRFEFSGEGHRLGPYATEREALSATHMRFAALVSRSTLYSPPPIKQKRRSNGYVPPPQRSTLRSREQRVGYRGVIPQSGGYIVQFTHQGQKLNFGWFKCKEQAARIYDEQVFRLRGSNARFNLPEQLFC